MKTIPLKYFSVVLTKDDIIDKDTGYPLPLNPIFNGLTRYCKKHGYGTDFSLNGKGEFVVSNWPETFCVYSIRINGQKYSTTLSEKYIKSGIQDNHTVIVTMLQSLPVIN